MHRAILVSAGTVAGLVALLGYKSAGTDKTPQVTAGLPSTPSTGPPPPSTPSTGPPPTATTTPTTAPSTTVPAEKAVTGSDIAYRYGDLQVSVTIRGGKVINLSVPRDSDSRSQLINSRAVPILTREALAAQGINIDVVSGATYTSDAFAQALRSALNMASQ